MYARHLGALAETPFSLDDLHGMVTANPSFAARLRSATDAATAALHRRVVERDRTVTTTVERLEEPEDQFLEGWGFGGWVEDAFAYANGGDDGILSPEESMVRNIAIEEWSRTRDRSEPSPLEVPPVPPPSPGPVVPPPPPEPDGSPVSHHRGTFTPPPPAPPTRRPTIATESPVEAGLVAGGLSGPWVWIALALAAVAVVARSGDVRA